MPRGASRAKRLDLRKLPAWTTMARRLARIADSAQNLIVPVQDELKGVSSRADTLLTNLNDATGPANRENLAGILQQVNRMVAEQSPKIG
jgi:hypothetical protein